MKIDKYIKGLCKKLDSFSSANDKCIPECQFYPECGRIEDELVIEEHNKLVESYRQNNSIVEPPSESVMKPVYFTNATLQGDNFTLAKFAGGANLSNTKAAL